MLQLDVPALGKLVLALALVASAYTFALSLASVRGGLGLLHGARKGLYATSALVAMGVCVLAYAFLTHDFRIIYVERYSDRSMPWYYLLTSLWGGQDGSLLWWTLLLCGYSTAFAVWVQGRHVQLQPAIIAVLSSIVAFFLLLQLFSANPFATYVGDPPLDGSGLNPLLQNYWMMIHPPSLYMGFVGFSVPFAVVMAALITGRLGPEWIHLARPWVMIAWTFLSLGLLLGCIWSYEELGWGGYWAWDPVENASFMPWLVGTAYLHSAIIQERYSMMKVWNVFLMCLTFFMTIFGTFLTRSGLIASVHSFARSDIGNYFLGYLGVLIVVSGALIVHRLPELKGRRDIVSLKSREFAFLLNNWILLAIMVIVLFLTISPLVSEWLRGEEVTWGAAAYNQIIAPFGVVLLLLAGLGPLIAWRKMTGRGLLRAVAVPGVVGLVAVVVHVAFGASLERPPVVDVPRIFDTRAGDVFAWFLGIAPLLTTFCVFFVFASVAQEFHRGAASRARSKDEGYVTALARVSFRARRRYGGYLVHVGVAFMYLGFAGAAWDQEFEAALRPGDVMKVSATQSLRYVGPRMELDPEKRMVFADLEVLDRDRRLTVVSPAKFIYRAAPESPTTEVSIRSRLKEDLYVILSALDPQTKRAIIQVKVRPLVLFIWLGGMIALLGSIFTMLPDPRQMARRALVPTTTRPLFAASLLVLLLGAPFAASAPARADSGSSSLHAGSITIDDPFERELFGRLLCQCGACERLPLDTCACGWADDKRREIRERLAVGESPDGILASYRALYGVKALSVPPDEGLDRVTWALPIALSVFAVGLVLLVGRRLKARTREALATPTPGDEDFDARLERELSRLDEEP
jgi:cytochrome c-type biogenesis protein CcmF